MVSKPDPIDVHVGARVRLRRSLLGMSQEKLGTALGLTFQQIQKYERGANRIGSSRLYKLSRILDVPVAFFFEDMPDDAKGEYGGLEENSSAAFAGDMLARRETIDLLRAYYGISSAEVRRRIYEVAKAISEETPSD